MRGNASHGQRARTEQDRKVTLITALYSCRPEMLARYSVDQLMAQHGCDRRTTQYELMIAQQKRAAQ